jgi:NAD(P)-dependent dehydrogenase (short-subunit alcohol dehydrogenase family)
MNMKKSEEKVTVVTGGSRGIGAAIAKELGKEGATFAINDNHSHEHAQTVVEEIKAMGSSAIALQADISKAEPTQVFIWRSTASLRSWLTTPRLPELELI